MLDRNIFCRKVVQNSPVLPVAPLTPEAPAAYMSLSGYDETCQEADPLIMQCCTWVVIIMGNMAHNVEGCSLS